MITRLLLVFALCLGGSAFTGSECLQKAIDPEQNSTFQTQLDALLKSEFSSDEPGGSFLVAKGDSILFVQGYGLADLNSREPITPHTVFNTGSISKTFVANAILKLHEEGHLALTDAIGSYFDFDHPDVLQHTQILHLLSHTSGMPDLRRVASNTDFYLNAKDQENFDPLLALDELLFQSGERFLYSNPSYNGLALIIEQVTQMKWQDYVDREIFDPAQMHKSTITDGPHPEAGVAHAYQLVGDRYEEYDYGEFPTFCAAGNGGVWSSVLELFAYEKALQEGKILSPGMFEQSREIFHPHNWKWGEPHVGLCWWMGEKNLFPQEPFAKNFVFHTGSQGGFRGFHIVVPEEELVFIALCNRPIDRNLIEKCIHIVAEADWFNR